MSPDIEGKPIRLVIGLGNEGDAYARTFHNVGVFVVSSFEQLIRDSGTHFSVRLVAQVGGYMNVIGIPIRQIIAQHGMRAEECLIVHDEADLPIGEYRLSFGGGSAGHRGVASVIENVGTDTFWRLRIGVRDTNEVVRRKAEDFVLSRWSQKDELIFRDVAQRSFSEIVGKELFRASQD